MTGLRTPQGSRGRNKRDVYHVLASYAYMVFGLVIVVRAVIGHAWPVGILGIVLLALGLVRLRDYARFRGQER